jgi:hypothetical protein
MVMATIRRSRLRGPRREADVWFARAEQARRIAPALAKRDSEIALAYAAECEREGRRLLDPHRPPMAA